MKINKGMELLPIIDNMFSSPLDEDTIIGLLYILISSDIHVVSDRDESGFLIVNHTQRLAGEVISKLMPEKNYTEWLGVYMNKFGANFHEVPPNYEKIVSDVKEQLLLHPSVLLIEEG